MKKIVDNLKQQAKQNTSLLKRQTALFAEITKEMVRIGSIIDKTNKQLAIPSRQKFQTPPFYKIPLEKPKKEQRTVSPSAPPTAAIPTRQRPQEQQAPSTVVEKAKSQTQPIEQQPVETAQPLEKTIPTIPRQQPKSQPDSNVVNYTAVAAGAALLTRDGVIPIMKEVVKGIFEGMFTKDVPDQIQRRVSEKTKEIQKLGEEIDQKKSTEIPPSKTEPKKEPAEPTPAPPSEAPKPPPPTQTRTVPWERIRPAAPPRKEPTVTPERIEVAPLKEEPKLAEAPKIEAGKAPVKISEVSPQRIEIVPLKEEPKLVEAPTIEPGKVPVKISEVAPQRVEVPPTKVGVPTLAEAPRIEKIPAPKPAAPAGPPPAPTLKPIKEAEVKPSGGGIFSSPEAFVKGLTPYAQKVSQMIGGKVPPVAILGQWAGESGYGKNLPADFNYAGIKWYKGSPYEKGNYVLTEERYTDAQLERAKQSGETLHRVLGQDDKMKKKGRDVTVDEWFGKGQWQDAKNKGQNWVQVRSYFAKFKDLEDFANSFAKFISSSRYAKAREQTTAAGFGYEIAKAGYATASAEKYSQKIASFEQQYGNKIQPTGGTMIAQAPTTGQAMNQTSGDVAFQQKQQSKEPTPIINIADNSTIIQRRKGSAPQSDSPRTVNSSLT